MNEAVRKAVTDALIELNNGNSMERLDKRISTLTDNVTELQTMVAVNNNDVSGSNTDGLLPEDTVHDAVGHLDRAAFRQARLRRRLFLYPMILMLRLSSQYHLFRVITMSRDILIGR